MVCDKHGPLIGPAALCPVCLLEQALQPASVRDLIIQVPLGHGADTSVFLVRQETPSPALLRLKVWRRPAPRTFLDGVAGLAARLEELADPAIAPPLAACVDAAGCPAVLSGFRQGLPILEVVRSGAITTAAGLELLEGIASVLRRCHDAGLAHGSVAPGNVLCQADGRLAFLVDFGLAALFGAAHVLEVAADDRARLAALERALRACG